jgi:hypothetical protein
MPKNAINETIESIEAKELKRKANRIKRNAKIGAIVLGAGIAVTGLSQVSCPQPASSEKTKETLQGTVAIDGTAQVGQTLTANTGGITNPKGDAAYQWKRGDADIDGATEEEYLLIKDDQGKTITVTVTFSDRDSGITSAPTVKVYYDKLGGKFPVFQDEGVTDEQMAASFATWQEAYDEMIGIYGVSVFDNKITEIHVIAGDLNYTWDNNNKILGSKQGREKDYYVILLARVKEGVIVPTVAQAFKEQFIVQVLDQIKPSQSVVAQELEAQELEAQECLAPNLRIG